MSDLRIVLTQILPNCLAPVLVNGSILVASAILSEAGLSFLGLGDPNVVSWGSMIGAGGRCCGRRGISAPSRGSPSS